MLAAWTAGLVAGNASGVLLAAAYFRAMAVVAIFAVFGTHCDKLLL